MKKFLHLPWENYKIYLQNQGTQKWSLSRPPLWYQDLTMFCKKEKKKEEAEPEAEPYSISPVIALVLEEHDSKRFCIFSSSSCISFCLILILASITRCSSCKKGYRDIKQRSFFKLYRDNKSQWNIISKSYNLFNALFLLWLHSTVLNSIVGCFTKRASHNVKEDIKEKIHSN